MKIYVGTYNKYNNGNIAGAWLTLSDYDDAQDFLAACYKLHNDESDPELMFQDFDDIHKNYQRECVDLNALYEYVIACNDNIKDVIDAGLDCEIPLDSIMVAYIGQYDSDSDFAYDMADQCGYLTLEANAWPYNCIDWHKAARELMYDNVESKGHYFNCHF
jgi:antirestriction protein